MLYCSLKAFEFLTWISSISSRAQTPCAWTFATTRLDVAVAVEHAVRAAAPVVVEVEELRVLADRLLDRVLDELVQLGLELRALVPQVGQRRQRTGEAHGRRRRSWRGSRCRHGSRESGGTAAARHEGQAERGDDGGVTETDHECRVSFGSSCGQRIPRRPRARWIRTQSMRAKILKVPRRRTSVAEEEGLAQLSRGSSTPVESSRNQRGGDVPLAELARSRSSASTSNPTSSFGWPTALAVGVLDRGSRVLIGRLPAGVLVVLLEDAVRAPPRGTPWPPQRRRRPPMTSWNQFGPGRPGLRDARQVVVARHALGRGTRIACCR